MVRNVGDADISAIFL